MKKTNNKKNLLLLILGVVLVAAAVLYASGILGGKAAPEAGPAVVRNGDTVGQGAKVFPFTIVDKDGTQTAITVKTDKQTVGEALQENGLIEGEEGAYGLYVKKVNGIPAEYEVDGTYWAFYIDDAYAATGVDVTEIQEESAYMMRVEK